MGWTRRVWASEPSPPPAWRRVGAVRGPGSPASLPLSSRPRTSVCAGRRAGHACRSCRRLRPCRKLPPPPPPPAPGPVSFQALQFACLGPVPPLLGPALPERLDCSFSPAPPPTPAQQKEGWGKGAGAPSPFTSSRALPSLLSPNLSRHAGICSPAGQDLPAVLRIRDYHSQKAMHSHIWDHGLCSSARIWGVKAQY